MESALEFGVIAAAVVCLTALSLMVIRMASFGKRTFFAKPAGDTKKGILYAFGRGMLPGEKESARHNIVTYMAGVVYHLSTFVALLYVLLVIVIPGALEESSLYFALAALPGLAAGVGLFLKRLSNRTLRAISCPDDYASNAMVDVFLASVVFDALDLAVRPILLSVSILLFLYIPVGKIRHCFFFFYMRILFGRFYGSRGVVPHQRSHNHLST